jgi:hypothetical protein
LLLGGCFWWLLLVAAFGGCFWWLLLVAAFGGCFWVAQRFSAAIISRKLTRLYRYLAQNAGAQLEYL